MVERTDGGSVLRRFGQDNRAVVVLLLVLVLTDVCFLALHLYAVAREHPDGLFYLDVDRSYSEVFQYLKYVWLMALLGLYAVEQRVWQVAAWLPLFAYFLVDDAMRVHERGGAWFAANTGLTDRFGLRAVDFGELAVSALAGAILIVPLLAGYLRGDARTRWIFRWVGGLVGVLVVFGVLIDMLHIVVVENPSTGDWMGFVEDGGEMLALTAVVAFAVRINLSGGMPGFPARLDRADQGTMVA